MNITEKNEAIANLPQAGDVVEIEHFEFESDDFDDMCDGAMIVWDVSTTGIKSYWTGDGWSHTQALLIPVGTRELNREKQEMLEEARSAVDFVARGLYPKDPKMKEEADRVTLVQAFNPERKRLMSQ